MALCVSFRTGAHGDIHLNKTQNQAAVEEAKRDCIVTTAESMVGVVVEKTGRNDHPMIDTFFVVVGQKNLVKADWRYKPWCAAFTGYCLLKCGAIPPVKIGAGIASVRMWESDKARLKPQNEAEPGDVVTYTTWSHAEIVKDYNRNPRVFTFRTVGGNTESPGGGKYGVWEKVRQKRQIKKVIDSV